jgi:NAD(P)-dependent dehydrogenase (short-subunit alcohol dehydrogenase family)
MSDRPVYLVTGAAGSLGRAVVRALLNSASQVAALDHSPIAAEALPGALCVPGVDLRDASAVQAAVARVHAHFGRIDGLVNVAGGFAWEKLEGNGSATWQRMFELNLLTTLHTCQAVLPWLLAQGRGHIVNIGAAAAGKAGLGMGAYAASKAAVQRLSEALNEEVKDRGVHVHVLLPTVLDTPANRRDMPDADASRWVQPEALAEVAVFLLGEGARAMYGAAVPVAGRM